MLWFFSLMAMTSSSVIPVEFQTLFFSYIRANINITSRLQRISLFYCFSGISITMVCFDITFRYFFHRTLPSLYVRIPRKRLKDRFDVGGFY